MYIMEIASYIHWDDDNYDVRFELDLNFYSVSSLKQ